ncbi:MAG: M14 family metallopeptidase [Gemmiger sp.]|uniref:M14 family metallopeptidase n=1 Tax=Gemmiger sp. TaxID=2049027 RepID=UPI002E762E83|nr:M14 family metallopeptidase [Gemmiger sp.]MEE0800672.1 M14 family metallopeptidase [Gemmiger sp.]
MKEEVLFTIDTPYRPALQVRAWRFGDPGQKSLAVMGSLRGNEIQQMYICGQLIQALKAAESSHQLSPECGILVIPCANQFSMNVGRRFWAADNTDINRMFPGYDQGETTQRIAADIFQALQGYTYGVHLTSFYLPGDHLPHVRMMDTGYQHIEEAAAFGLPYIVLRTPRAYDTTTLNYNWQIWNTQAFSLYSTSTDCIDEDAARLAVGSILRFLAVKGLLHRQYFPAAGEPRILRESTLHNILSHAGGLMLCRRHPGDAVEKEELLGEILNPCTGQVLESLRSDCRGRVFFCRRSQLVNGHEVAFRILPASDFQ